MADLWLQLADYFFLLFHTSLIFFNLFGWVIQSLRVWNLVTLLLTALSWFGLGIFYGIGYCPLTDWHWTVLQELGHTHLPASYVQYLFERLIGWSITPLTADYLTVSSFFMALVLSIILNIRDYRRKKC
ncbi:MAG: DUF2784 family protein [Saprospirales bacterium]|nr:MAG: DUF2784 family protein [Saprospirales bacterium]